MSWRRLFLTSPKTWWGMIDGLVCPACGLTHADARVVELPDGRQVGSYSEQYRLYCEAKWVLKNKRTKNTRRKYLLGVEAERGTQAMQELRAEMLLQYEWKKAK